jgi:hypothetical protein
MKALFKILFLILISLLFGENLPAQAIPVELKLTGNGSWQLIRDGEPYRIKGAGTSNPERFRELYHRGGNSVRTWGVDENTLEMLDSAHHYGISVMLGLWIGREKDGFDYNDSEKVTEQLARFTTIVQEYKDHPALLAWGIGNEANLGYTNVKVWDAVNDLSRMIHEVDGNHPTATVTAGISNQLANVLAERCSDLDFLGVNIYGGIGGVGTTIKNSSWAKPYVLTEWGINGPWETGESAWGAPIEPTSTQKAQTFKTRYELFIAPNQTDLLGSYAFLWNEKFEATLTWFGLFVRDETTPMIDVLQEKWSGTGPPNSAPVITGWSFPGQGQKTSYKVFRSSNNELEINAFDPDGDELSFEYLIRPEEGSEGLMELPGATYSAVPGIIDQDKTERAFLTFNGTQNKKEYRIYVLIRDGFGHVATLTLPLYTELVDLQEEYEFLPREDAYVRNNEFRDSLLGISDLESLRVIRDPNSGDRAEIYLLFDLNQAPPEYDVVTLELSGMATEEATVELWGFGGLFWKEEQLSWSNRIIPGSGVLSLNQPHPAMNDTHTWELTDFVNKQFTQKNKVLTLVLRPKATHSIHGSFVSKEGNGNSPRIVFSILSKLSRHDPEIDLRVYPNPARHSLHLQWDQKSFRASTYSIHSWHGGQVVPESAMESGNTMNIHQLTPGMYSVVLTDRETGRRAVAPFIKL